MKLSNKKIQEVLKKFSTTLEERDNEDMKLYGWKGGQVTSYRSRLDIDNFLDSEEEKEE